MRAVSYTALGALLLATPAAAQVQPAPGPASASAPVAAPASAPALAGETDVAAPGNAGDAQAPETAASTATVSAEPEGADKRQWQAQASAQYRQLAVQDPDPANDRAILYTLGGSVGVFERARVFVRFGMSERFVAEGQESGFKLRDTVIGLNYSTPISLGSKELGLAHRLAFFLPTSRASLAQDLYVAPQYVLAASLEVVKGLTLSLSPDARYRWHQYAERAGYDGALNVQWELGLHGGLDWTFLDSPRFGALSVGASTGSGWQRKYASRDEHITDDADAAVWSQSYDWDVHVGYDPVKYLSLGVALEHGGSVLRDGVVNTFFTHRDETELSFTVTGTY